VPIETAGLSSTMGKETHHVRSATQRRPETGSGQRTSGWQGATRRPWPASQAAPNLVTGIQARYEAELAVLDDVYPGTRIFRQDGGMWLLAESSLLPSSTLAATFAVAISFRESAVRSWGFWGGVLAGSSWIGPRHTNFPDGSICAFDLRDQTWTFGEPIINLLDLYSLWAVRHLHLQTFGRWPGRQDARDPYERILEFRLDEYCGCQHSDRLYGECCHAKDLARNRLADALHFLRRSGGGLREPPPEVVRFVCDQRNPPAIDHLILPMSELLKIFLKDIRWSGIVRK